MRGPLRSFTARLIAALAVLIVGLAAIYLALMLMTTRANLQAVDQSLNLDIAAHIRDKYLADAAADPGSAQNAAAFTSLMELNPDAEIYLLDAGGRILGHAAPVGKIKLSAVSLAPIRALLSRSRAFPIRGDDPRDPSSPKVFSAAEISRPGQPPGYVYVVLGGEAYNSAASMFRTSYVLRLSGALLAGGVLITLLLGGLSFYRITAPLRHLTRTVAAFEPGRAGRLAQIPEWKADDEIGQLARSFASMVQRIETQIDMLRAADAMRREFMVYMSHDLKTPIAGIQGYLETLLMKWDEMPGEQRNDYLTAALKANTQIFGMIEAIFELASLEGSDAPLRYETFSVTELLQDICQKLQLEAEAATVTIAADWDAPNVYLSGDIGLIERALVNIIQNAIKFSQMSGEVRVTARAAPAEVSISVANGGAAIEPDEIEKVFVPFYRGKKIRQSTKGNGLGLTIAKRIVHLHGGSLALSSAEARGTVVTIAMPVSPGCSTPREASV